MLRCFVIGGLVLAMGSLAGPQLAAAAQPVVQVVTVKVEPGKLEQYRQELKKVRGVMTRIGSKATMRVWNTTTGGTEAGQILVGLEYPDSATWAADSGKLQADAEWQKIQAGLVGVRTVVSNELWRDVSTEASAMGTGSTLVLTGVAVKPGKFEEYRQRVASSKAISDRLKVPGRVRIWQADLAGTATGAVDVGIEYPDVSAYVAAQDKLGADAEWQKFRAGLDDVRTINGRWLYSEITP
jgi:hypothetical protein